MVELHTHEMDGDMARMRQVPEIAVPAGETVELAPRGLHVMLMGVESALREGDTLDLTLIFETAGEVTVQVPVHNGALTVGQPRRTRYTRPERRTGWYSFPVSGGFMSFVQSIVLGIMQGISEFIPISSSGHLVVLRAVMGIGEIPLLYDVILHIATLIVVVVFFRERIGRMLVALLRWARRQNTPDDAEDLKLTVLIIIGTAVTVAIALVIRRFDLHNQPKIVSGAFLVTAALLILAHFARGTTGYGGIGTKHALIVGAVQGLAVIPGISRSGSTITAALYSGISREKAGEFSFLLSIPAILGAMILEMRHLGELGTAVGTGSIVAGFIASMIFGFLSLSLLVRLIRGGKLWVFSVYLIPLGIWGLFSL